MKVALVYDRVNKWGGAERVLLALHELFPDAPLYTSVYNAKTAPWADVFQIHTSFLQHIPLATLSHEKFAMLMPLAFESFNFDAYDLVISVTSEAAKGIITKPGTMHICYCLTPTRYLWTGYENYFANPLLKATTSPIIAYLRKWDRIASKRPDAYIAISREVERRIATYYDAPASVVYPPVSIHSTKKVRVQKGDYYLVVSRLVPYKRVDLAIAACNALKIPLKIIGVGSEEKYLRQMANKNVTFLGRLTDDELMGYYYGCKAVLFPSNEDFGIVPLEAQLCGKPVIAYRAGGAVETVINGKTGVFFSAQTVESLMGAIRKSETMHFRQIDLKKQAVKFSKENFKEQFMKEIDKYTKTLH